MPHSYEELEVWQKALKLFKLTYTLTVSKEFATDYSLAD